MTFIVAYKLQGNFYGAILTLHVSFIMQADKVTCLLQRLFSEIQEDSIVSFFLCIIQQKWPMIRQRLLQTANLAIAFLF